MGQARIPRFRAEYTTISGDHVIIVDMRGPSQTSNIKDVFEVIRDTIPDLPSLIVFRNRSGSWDAIIHENGVIEGFWFCEENSPESVVARLRERKS